MPFFFIHEWCRRFLLFPRAFSCTFLSARVLSTHSSPFLNTFTGSMQCENLKGLVTPAGSCQQSDSERKKSRKCVCTHVKGPARKRWRSWLKNSDTVFAWCLHVASVIALQLALTSCIMLDVLSCKSSMKLFNSPEVDTATDWTIRRYWYHSQLNCLQPFEGIFLDIRPTEKFLIRLCIWHIHKSN